MLSLAFCSQTGFARSGDTNEEQTQQIMERGQNVLECLGRIEASETERIAEQSKSVQSEIEGLCKAGKRDQAQDIFSTFKQRLLNDQAVLEIKKCGDSMEGLLPQFFIEHGADSTDEVSDSKKHICDDITDETTPKQRRPRQWTVWP